MKLGYIHFFKLLYVKFNYHDILAKSAEITYYLFFSIFPLFLLILSLLPLLNLEPTFLSDIISNNLSTELFTPLIYFVDYLVSNPSTTALGLGIFLTLFSASSATNALIKNLNKIYEVNLTRSFLRFRLISIASTLLLILMFFSTIILYSITSDFFIQFLSPELAGYLSQIKDIVLPLFFVAILAYLYIVSPVSTNYGYQVIPGVIFSVIMFNLLNGVIMLYIELFGDIPLTYGTITSIIIFMLYLYINTGIVLVGGLINSTLMDLKGITNTISQEKGQSHDNLYQQLIDCYKINNNNMAPASKTKIHSKDK